MPPLTFFHGKEVHELGEAMLNAWFVTAEGTEIFIREAEGRADSGVRHASADVKAAIRGARTEVGGLWTKKVVGVEDGVIIKFMGSRKCGSMGIKLPAALIIQCRAEAAHRRAAMKTLQTSDSQFQSVFIEGRFDVLSLDELQSQRGYICKPQFRQQFSMDRVESVFNLSIIQKEVRSRESKTITVVHLSPTEKIHVPMPVHERYIPDADSF